MNCQIASKRDQTGFTLLEIAIIVGIVGLLVGSYLSFYQPDQTAKSAVITQQRIDRVLDAAASYASAYNRLPAPNGTAVPAQLLGLSIADVTDAFGQPLRYAVAANALRDMYAINGGAAINVPSPVALTDTGSPRTGRDTGYDAGDHYSWYAYTPVKAIDDRRSYFCYDGTATYYGVSDPDFVITPPATTYPGLSVTRPGAASAETNRAFIVVSSSGMDRAFGTADDQLEYLTGPAIVSRPGATQCHDYPAICDCAQYCSNVPYAWAWQCSYEANAHDMEIYQRANNYCNPAANDKQNCHCCARTNSCGYINPQGGCY